jgi:hypothetical protein
MRTGRSWVGMCLKHRNSLCKGNCSKITFEFVCFVCICFYVMYIELEWHTLGLFSVVSVLLIIFVGNGFVWNIMRTTIEGSKIAQRTSKLFALKWSRPTDFLSCNLLRTVVYYLSLLLLQCIDRLSWRLIIVSIFALDVRIPNSYSSSCRLYSEVSPSLDLLTATWTRDISINPRRYFYNAKLAEFRRSVNIEILCNVCTKDVKNWDSYLSLKRSRSSQSIKGLAAGLTPQFSARHGQEFLCTRE